MSKIIIFNGYWSIADVKKYKNALFVYGDNDAGLGKRGQAIIRGLSNTIGIPTKKYPSNNNKSFYNDGEFDENIIKIKNAINNIIKESIKYKYVVFPEDGFGTGLARLPTKAPKTYQFLVESIEDLKKLMRCHIRSVSKYYF